MYLLNALHLKQFYASDLGKTVAKQMRGSLEHFWQRSDTESQLFLGYPIPLFGKGESVSSAMMLVMPSEQGAVRWPYDEASSGVMNKVIISHDAELPIPSNSMNRVVLIHALEFSPNVRELMEEIYRILVPNGRVMIIAPNRMGLWARSSKSPFGYGRPFSSAEIKSLLEHTEFTFRRMRSIMFMPPTEWRWLLKIVPCAELIGQMLLPMCGGMHVVEAEKQLYANVMQPKARRPRMPFAKPASVAAVKAPRTQQPASCAHHPSKQR